MIYKLIKVFLHRNASLILAKFTSQKKKIIIIIIIIIFTFTIISSKFCRTGTVVAIQRVDARSIVQAWIIVTVIYR